jgi:putative transcriptional regulator
LLAGTEYLSTTEIGSMRGLTALLIVCLGILPLTGVTRGLCDSQGGVPTQPMVAASQEDTPAAGMFLVAQRSLHDPYFGRTVILLLQHNNNGSVGLIINHRFNLQLSDAVENIDKVEASKHTLFFGGPLGTHRVFMLMRNGDITGQAHQITSGIYFSAHRETLEHALERKTPDSELRLFLGYSSWSAGQLAAELVRGSWHLAAGDSESIFDSASDGLWERLIETLEPSGIEVKRDNREDLFKPENGVRTVGLSTISSGR